jgi:hypothetical protein
MVTVGSVFGNALPGEDVSEVEFETLVEAELYLDWLENQDPEGVACELYFVEVEGEDAGGPG